MGNNIFQEQVDVVKTGIERLLKLFETELKDKTASKREPFERELKDLEAQRKVLEEAYEKLTPIAEAKERLLLNQVDQMIVEGRQEDADKLRKEAQEVKNSLQALEEKREKNINRHLWVSEWEIDGAPGGVYADTYDSVKESLLQVQASLIKLMDGTANVLEGFIQKHHLNNFSVSRDTLTSPETSPTWQRLWLWFSGRK